MNIDMFMAGADRMHDDEAEGIGNLSTFCPDCGEPANLCECDENHDNDWEDYDTDDEYCELCGGEGIVITCLDDICVGGGHCIHGDGEQMCPKCGPRLQEERWMKELVLRK